MRTKFIALSTSLALLATPAVALAEQPVDQEQTTSSVKDASSEEFREGSSYLKWLDENVGTTENEDLNVFLELLVDFLIGAGIMVVAGTIIGGLSRLLP